MVVGCIKVLREEQGGERVGGPSGAVLPWAELPKKLMFALVVWSLNFHLFPGFHGGFNN